LDTAQHPFGGFNHAELLDRTHIRFDKRRRCALAQAPAAVSTPRGLVRLLMWRLDRLR